MEHASAAAAIAPTPLLVVHWVAEAYAPLLTEISHCHE
jgi:hypothetical protein